MSLKVWKGNRQQIMKQNKATSVAAENVEVVTALACCPCGEGCWQYLEEVYSSWTPYLLVVLQPTERVLLRLELNNAPSKNRTSRVKATRHDSLPNWWVGRSSSGGLNWTSIVGGRCRAELRNKEEDALIVSTKGIDI